MEMEETEMSSGAEMIRRGLREAVVGVGVVIDTGLERAADALDRISEVADDVYDKVSQAANGVLDEIERAATLLDESTDDDASPKVITKEMVLEASAAMGRDKLGINTWDWLCKESTYNMLRDSYGLQLRRYKALGFFMEDVERLIEAADFVSPGAIPGFGPSMVDLLAKVVKQV